MRYIDARWRHESRDDPVRLLSEIDADGYETRKIEVFAYGHAQYADQDRAVGDTRLSDQPIPTSQEIAGDRQFTVRPIDADEFEANWQQATDIGSLSPN